MVRLRRPDPAGHHLSRTLGLHLAARPADLRAPTAPADAIRQPVVEPDRDVRAFQIVLLDLGARLGLPGFVTEDRRAALSRRLSGLHRQPRAQPGHRLARRLPRRGRQELRPRRAQREPARRLHRRTAASTSTISRRSSATTSTPTRPISTGPRTSASSARPRRSCSSSIWSRCRNSASPRAGHGAVQPPATHRARIETYFDPMPFWYRAVRRAAPSERAFLFTPSRSGRWHMYHSWGSQNAWLRQITARELPLHESRARRESSGIADGDWVWIDERDRPRQGRSVKLMEGVNPDTVWTWNAIGKRAGAWASVPTRRKPRAASCSITSSANCCRARGRLPLLQRRSGHRPGRLVRPARQHREGRARRGRAVTFPQLDSRIAMRADSARQHESPTMHDQPARNHRPRSSASSSISTPASAARPARRAARNGTPAAIPRR